MSKELNKAPVEQAEPASCQGTNCGTTTGDHSSECLAEAAASQGWELKPGDLCGRDCPMRLDPAEQAGGDERAGLRAAAKWHREQRNAFEAEAEMHRQRYENTNRPDSLTAEAEHHRRLWETASAMAANHLDYAAGFEEMARAALAQPSPASDLDPLNLAPHAGAFNEAPDEALRPEQAEAERPEVVARVVHSNPVVLDHCGPLNANDELMTVAQHAASVARWAEMFNRVEQERDAALARVEELGAKLGAALELLRESRGFVDCDNPLNESGQIKLLEEIDVFLTSPIAQAQHSVPDEVWDSAIRAAEKLCLERADYYNGGDDDNPNSRRGSACRSCAEVIKYNLLGRMAAAAPGKEVGHE
ncbi:hypothetical protein [Pseudomonas aeruginosa]|uniref:hypothetical protein n=1 Tax=Pseudomonas aeruginosa TaxID=287 RepID=UPI00178C2125|nr:hypothetical protein [Pseudomonas aeruginosa]